MQGYTNQLAGATNAQRQFNSVANSGINRLGQNVQRFGQSGGQILRTIFNGAQEALLEFVRTGEFDFKKFIRGIAEDLLRLFTNQLFGRFLSGIFGGFGGIGGALGGGLFGGFGFQKGGYTGGGPVNKVAGVVHGQEFVMPAAQTKLYRPLLEAMRSGRSVGTQTVRKNEGSSGGNVIIHNYTDSQVAVKENQNGDKEITMRRIAIEAVRSEGPRIFASNLQNGNSRESKAINRSFKTQRKRT